MATVETHTETSEFLMRQAEEELRSGDRSSSAVSQQAGLTPYSDRLEAPGRFPHSNEKTIED